MMRRFPTAAARGRPWTAARRLRGFVATWLQHRRRARPGKLLPAPVLVPRYPSLAGWRWNLANPSRWNAYNSLDNGLNYAFDDFVTGDLRQYAPDGGQHLMFIVGVDANGIEITERSNAVRPDNAVTAAGFIYQWGTFKAFIVKLEVSGVVLSEFQSFQLRYNRVSQPGVWTNSGAKTVFSPTLLSWTTLPLTEGEDYVFELTVTELGGVVTVTTDAINVGYS
jgi:hypothetical protein